MGPVHDFNNFPINVSGLYSLLFPFILQRLRRPFQIGEGAAGFTPFCHGSLSHTEGYFIQVTIELLTVNLDRRGNAEVGGDLDQLGRIFDGIIFAFLSGNGKKGFRHATAVIGVGG